MLASLPSLGNEVGKDEEELLKRAIATSLEEEEEEEEDGLLFSVKGDLLKKAACQIMETFIFSDDVMTRRHKCLTACHLGNTSQKKCFLSGIARMRGGNGPCPN